MTVLGRPILPVGEAASELGSEAMGTVLFWNSKGYDKALMVTGKAE